MDYSFFITPVTSAVIVPTAVTLIGVGVQLVAERPMNRKHWLLGKDFCLAAFVLALTNLLVWQNNNMKYNSAPDKEIVTAPSDEVVAVYLFLLFVSLAFLVFVMFLYRTHIHHCDEERTRWEIDRKDLRILELTPELTSEEMDKLQQLTDQYSENTGFIPPKIHWVRWALINAVGLVPIVASAMYLLQ